MYPLLGKVYHKFTCNHKNFFFFWHYSGFYSQLVSVQTSLFFYNKNPWIRNLYTSMYLKITVHLHLWGPFWVFHLQSKMVHFVCERVVLPPEPLLKLQIRYCTRWALSSLLLHALLFNDVILALALSIRPCMINAIALSEEEWASSRD